PICHPLLARLQPAARRFCRNAEELGQRDIRTPQVIETFWLDRAAGLSGCLYRPLPGISVEQLYRQAPQRITELLPALASFIRHLHERGIYFRSLHLGNIIRMPDGQFGLIDILDLRCRQGALSSWQVKRNLGHLRRYLERRKLTDFPFDALCELYRHPARSQASPPCTRHDRQSEIAPANMARLPRAQAVSPTEDGRRTPSRMPTGNQNTTQ
ncbi:hypothetical protein V2S84_18440, partial [Azotobacter chroococcum]|nr:hypothetical protein [Azotobacter chroococcum]